MPCQVASYRCYAVYSIFTVEPVSVKSVSMPGYIVLLLFYLVFVCLLLHLERANGSSVVGHFSRKGAFEGISKHLKDTSPEEQGTKLPGGPWVSLTRQPGPAARPDRDIFELAGPEKDTEADVLVRGDLEGSDWSVPDLRDSKNARDKRAIFGKLTWRREKPRGYPGYALGRLGNGCTVFFIGPFQALTAAHCVYSRSKRQWEEWALDIANLGDCTKPYLANGYKKEWVSVHVSQRYIEAGLWAEDVALIVTRNCVCLRGCHCLGLQPAEYPTELGSQHTANITIYGYPLHVRNAVSHPPPVWYPLYCLVSSSCADARTSPYFPNLLEYKCDTTQGMSGGPIMAQDLSSNAEEYFVYGVHSLSFVNYKNLGVKFTSAKIDQIQSLVCNITAIGYPPFCHTNDSDISIDSEQMNSTNVTEVTVATAVPTTSPFKSVTRSRKSK